MNRAAAFDPSSAGPEWADAFRAVPRASFLPRRMWPFDTRTKTHSLLDRDQSLEAWREAAQADVPITTQWDDGHHEGDEPGALPSSSCSMPSLVADMLRLLDVRPGMRVLEIGTGTGWNAGLLTHRLGDDQVVTVEVDAEVAEQARAALKGVGLAPRLVTGDGAAGRPDQAPYDRVIATCGLRRVPFAWVEQTRPGGLILAPWGTQFASGDALARLVVSEDGVRAEGRLVQQVGFMKLRAQRLAWPEHAEYVVGEWPHGADTARTDLGPEVVTPPPGSPTAFVLGLVVPECTHVSGEQNGETAAWFYSLRDTSSWAAVRFSPGERGGEVYQYGPRRLWDEVEAAWRWWDAQGRPGVDRFGLTVTPEGEQVWLDTAEQPVGR